MQQFRNTKQHEYILKCLKQNANKHLTPQDIEELLLKDSKSVGIATIYRQLDKLVKQGVIRKISVSGQNKSCYQYIQCKDCSKYYHLICCKCSKVVHFQNEILNKAFFNINKINEFKLDVPKTMFYGTCKQCASNDQN